MTNITFSRNVMFLNVKCEHSDLVSLPVADPGFPRGGGANSPGGCQHTILPNFLKNCMKLKEFGPPGGGACVQNFTM